MKKYIKNLILRISFCTIIYLVLGIIFNFNNKNITWFKTNIFNPEINLTLFNDIYNKYIYKYIPFNINNTKLVNNETLTYKTKTSYLNGVKLTLTDNNIEIIKGGLVTYIGDKDKLGKTIIIQGIDGIDYWYSNIDNIDVNLYDYVENNKIIGTTLTNELYITFVKDGKYLNYEEYI